MLLGIGLFGLIPKLAHAEYRAYELEVTDLYECRVSKRKDCKTQVVRTAQDPEMYARTHGGSARLGVIVLAHWMCRGDTSNYLEICPRPPAKNPKFQPGDTVKVTLKKHITEGWKGTVELVYYQAMIQSNVYGIRFTDRRGVYARYFEKDLTKEAEAPQSVPPQ